VAAPARAEELVPAPAEFPPATVAEAAVPPPIVSNDELLDRLRRTESQLEALTTERQQDALHLAWQERWQQVRDPSITTVDQQTHNTLKKEAPKKWYDRLSVRGYAQFRLNTTTVEEPGSAPAQHAADRSVGPNQEFFIRRARVILSGDVSDHMYVYIQPEFAASVPNSTDANQYAQIRDWYGDLYIDEDKVHRVRIGQSKVPFGWENLQSSSNRLPFDRSESLNSAARNERDLGVFYYWTPTPAQDLFKEVLDTGLKGSGNYGVFGIGVYNGQGGSFSEQNDNLHLVGRLAIPHKFENGQIIEGGVMAYTGKYTVLSAPIAPLGVGPAVRPMGAVDTGNVAGFRDERIGGTFVWYPQPFGFQAEWNAGSGPVLNDAQTQIIDGDVRGGYAMVMYRHETDCWGTMFPFLRYNQFRGGYKAERNAPNTSIDEYEFGVEWQFNPQMELTTMYTFTDRTNVLSLATGQSYRQFDGQLLRAQFQINY
jgi:hypothetical protein